LINFLNLYFYLNFFLFFLNKKFENIVTKRKLRVFTKKGKKTIIIVNSIDVELIKIIYFENIIAKVHSLRTLYLIACFIA